MTKEELRNWILFNFTVEKEFIIRYKEGVNVVIDEVINNTITQSIAEHEAKQWKKYPENVPEHHEPYLVFLKSGKIIIGYIDSMGWYSPMIFERKDIIAFRELPEPYQEGGEG